jgi:methyl-accepting chemotaxis protein
VRSLALRSAEAARNSANLIQEAIQNADRGVTINGEVLEKLGEIQNRIDLLGRVVAEISSSSGQQSRRVTDVHSRMKQASAVTEQVAAAAGESASAAEEMSGQAERMQVLVGSFRLQPDAQGRSRQDSTSRWWENSAPEHPVHDRKEIRSTDEGRSGILIPFPSDKDARVLRRF